MTTYSVIGLGKLGASMAAAIASRGFEVIGVDVLQSAVDAVNAGSAPVQETDLDATISVNRSRISATLSHRDAIMRSEVSFVIVPTPSDERGAFSLQYAAIAFREIGRALRDKQGYHLIVLTSTVLPGATRYGLLPLLERESGKKAGADFGLCYSPEFIALGSIIRNFLNPDFTLVGEYDERSGGILQDCYGAILENGAPCRRMSLENAELAKISLNSYVTMKITFANMLADLCERIPGADVDVVARAIGSDTRIGHKYLAGALGYGGPCFPRDNNALGWVARQLGTTADLAETTHRCNRELPGKVFERLRPLMKAGETVAVLGLAYKPFSSVIEESQGVELARTLADNDIRVIGYDPLAGEAAGKELSGRVLILDSLADCLEQADTVLITTPDPAFKALTRASFRRLPVTVVDFWRVLDAELSEAAGIRYVPIGRSGDHDANAARLESFWCGTKNIPD